jgi:hypothetical protein
VVEQRRTEPSCEAAEWPRAIEKPLVTGSPAGARRRVP